MQLLNELHQRNQKLIKCIKKVINRDLNNVEVNFPIPDIVENRNTNIVQYVQQLLINILEQQFGILDLLQS